MKWGVTDAVLIARSRMAEVYKVTHAGAPAVLKLFTPEGARDESRGSIALEAFQGRGAVRLLRHDSSAQLLEYAGQKDARDLPDAEATRVLGEVIAALEAPPVAGLVPLREWFAALFRKAGESDLFAHAAREADALLAAPFNEVALHGDIHHGNVLKSARGWIAIDPKGLRGEKTYDALNAVYNPIDRPDRVTDPARAERVVTELAARLAVDPERFRRFAFAYGALSAAWSLEDGDDPSQALRVAGILQATFSPLR